MRRIDLHTHTLWSLRDGCLTPSQLVRAAVRAGLDGIGVTDHYDYDDAFRGGLEAQAFAREHAPGLRVWTGVEYHVTRGAHRGHLLVFFDDPLEVPPRGLEAGELLDWCKARGLLTIHPHPFSMYGISDFGVIERSPFVELNGDHGPDGPNALVRSVARDRGWRLVASSDAHAAGQLGSAWTEVEAVYASLARTLACARRAPRLACLAAGRRGRILKHARIVLSPLMLPISACLVAGRLYARARAASEAATRAAGGEKAAAVNGAGSRSY